jgi:hypothetical protein
MSSKKPYWRHKRFKLPDDHGWRAPSPGHNVFIADQGAVRIEYPETWVVQPIEDDIAIGLYDKKPPEDNVRLAVSVMHLPQRVDWSGLPLELLVREVIVRTRPKDAGRQLTWQQEIRQGNRPSNNAAGYVETAWAQGAFIDPNEHRPACTRAGLARGGRDYIVQAQITMDYWPEDAERFEPVWDHALATMRLGEIIINPITHRDRPV